MLTIVVSPMAITMSVLPSIDLHCESVLYLCKSHSLMRVFAS